MDTYNAGTIVFVNFSRYRDDFTLVVFDEDFDRFPEPPERLYDEQRVWATGRVELYEGRPQMAIAEPAQMEVVGRRGRENDYAGGLGSSGTQGLDGLWMCCGTIPLTEFPTETVSGTWEKAQEITERWRAGLHHLINPLAEPGLCVGEKDEDRVLRTLERLSWQGMAPTARDISVRIRGVTTQKVQYILGALVRSGAVLMEMTSRTNRYCVPGSPGALLLGSAED